ncbi:MAG TPA: ribbon-helix-helix domain-containing protein [Candidatus Paceibacterota bacterium]|jgi:Arc/MetJ-type ribon-helix-helix transcriptional regulator|nr:ribbon-helix-helix domain-containing protein [Candidatus Paceibacterota bacterium]HOO47934.1 ribbon-helix-helix domain-containing protein [Candidatus Paceibacterota bacterium]HOX91111.1 ribbon-helix-helix domain-containing protein [Candidatus Paceibacterota bacterium]HPC12541.1 ribbon-helix-helix domain-containing protein [Candidatus Paceibacterota bacterium]HPI66654.1 ribbon-helix-helix domain-containing protein [Candidatus Paceibacterota bacterium]
MRSIVNISMPPNLKKEVEQIIKEENYASVSEFFRDAIRTWKENQIYNEIMQSEKEFTKGNGRVLKSLKELR